MDFAELYQTDVTKHIEKKGNFNYLSWPYAVAEFRKACPNGSWIVRHFGENNQPYCQTDAGCFVEVTVYPDAEKNGVRFTQVHPVLNHQNKTVMTPNAFEINTSIQRCLVKAIALATGIGLHIYAGEDLPESSEPKLPSPPISEDRANLLYSLIEETASDIDKFLDYYKIACIEDITTANYDKILATLQNKMGVKK